MGEYARRRGQDSAAIVDDALAEYPESESQEDAETADAVKEAYQAVKEGRSLPVSKFLDEGRQALGGAHET